eukprot:TRINITY_DN3752_c0_g1_i2.p1 TRINITY_DN3752_c0_g1~~TRINITY_DN3752_c0_g1_i2.p1  ORF type:complete len:410 (+),score=15.36 TRINITY_DN3752_c0_g1_i2:732-1961(+)
MNVGLFGFEGLRIVFLHQIDEFIIQLGSHARITDNKTTGFAKTFRKLGTCGFDFFGRGTLDERMDSLVPVDLAPFIKGASPEEIKAACAQLTESLRKTSCLIIRDPRVAPELNDKFIDLMEKYYSQPLEAKKPDIHPELSYQLGATPEGVEKPRDHAEVIKKLSSKPENAPHVPKGADAKWRFFWRIGERPKETKFTELNAPPVIPKAFPTWKETMDQWGTLMLQALGTVSQMLALGLSLPEDTFTSKMKYGPHLLAPTGSDLSGDLVKENIFAGFHYDLNFLTIHGKSRFPGLFIWLRDGTRMQVKVPDGCLLVQAGKQLEILTGGDITAGYHEVVVCPDTTAAIEKAKAAGRPLWRVSSTLFGHIASDQILGPVGAFATPENLSKYPPKPAGEQVREELLAIALAAK